MIGLLIGPACSGCWAIGALASVKRSSNASPVGVMVLSAGGRDQLPASGVTGSTEVALQEVADNMASKNATTRMFYSRCAAC